MKLSHSLWGSVLVAAPVLIAAQPANALAIIPIYDSSITSLANASTVESAFNTVAADYAKSFSSPSSVYIGVSWGRVDGYALPGNALGASIDPLYGYYSYSQVRNFLTTDAKNNPSDTALVTAVANLPSTLPRGETRFAIPSAEAKALGLISGNRSSFDGYIGFGGSTSNYTFNPALGIAPGTYDFEAVVAHEMSEVLGRISGLSSNNPSFATPFDLYRYSAPGTSSFSYNGAAYFSINGGKTNLGNFNNSSYGGDRGDWLTISTSRDAYDAFMGTGQDLTVSAADLTALDALGWTGVNAGDNGSLPTTIAFRTVGPVPEPPTLALVAAGLIGFGTLRRRKARKSA